jgi:hypothetical protein
MRRALLMFAMFAVPAAAVAQPAQQGQAPAGTPAEELVGLFGAACLHFAGNPAGTRGFLTQQHVPAMPDKARDAFLAGRGGQVFDASEPGVNLAVVSLDDGGCETVVEKANPAEVLATLQREAQSSSTPLTPLGGQADKGGANGVTHTAYAVNAGGRTMHILVSTETPSPQAVITLAPK